MEIAYFATVSDLKNILIRVESINKIKYTLMGNFIKSEYNRGRQEYLTADDIEQINNINSKQMVASPHFLITYTQTDIRLREFKDSYGQNRVCVDQLLNENSIVISLSGKYNNEVFVHGTFSTVSKSEESLQLFKNAKKQIQKTFSRVQSFYLGPEAKLEFEAGKRFACASVDSPREYDLSL